MDEEQTPGTTITFYSTLIYLIVSLCILLFIQVIPAN